MSITLTTTVEKKVAVKTVSVHAKVRDSASYEFKSEDGETVKDLDDSYVPDFFPTQHYGDYLVLDIDLSTGQILNWKAPTASELEELFNSEED